MQTPAEIALEYAPAPLRRSRGKIILRILLAGLILAVAAGIFLDRNDLWLRVRRVYWSDKCMAHVTPPGTVLVEYDSLKAATLLATNPDYVADGKQWGYNGMAVRDVQKSLWVTSAAVYWPRDWRNYIAVEPMPRELTMSPAAITFLGGRTSPGGNRRLIVVPVTEVNGLGPARELQAMSLILRPPTRFGAPAAQEGRAYNFSGRYERAFLSPGVADPWDSSHLTIDFDIPLRKGPRHGTVDIYLRDDDTLDCRVRDPATTHGL
jgi:hypothetical protein